MPSLPHGASAGPRTRKRRILRTAGIPIPFTLANWCEWGGTNSQTDVFETSRYAFPSHSRTGVSGWTRTTEAPKERPLYRRVQLPLCHTYKPGGEYRARTCPSRRYSGLAGQRASRRSHSPKTYGGKRRNRTPILSERWFSGPEADLPPAPPACRTLEHRANVEFANAWVAIRRLLHFAFRC